MQTEANQKINQVVSHTEAGDHGCEITMYNNQHGLTKREYFAASTGIQNEVAEMLRKPDPDYLTAITGVQQPKEDYPVKTKDLREWGKYWVDVEAALKVIKADALIAALNKV